MLFIPFDFVFAQKSAQFTLKPDLLMVLILMQNVFAHRVDI